MEYLVPFMPFLGTLPFAVAAVVITWLVLKARGVSGATQEELARLREAIERLRDGQTELQERIDVTERVVAQIRGAGRDRLGE